MAYDFDDLHAEEFAEFGDKALVRFPTGDIEIDVMLRDKTALEQIGKNTQMNDNSILLDMLSADVATFEIKPRQTITVRGVDYQLLAARLDEDSDGITVFEARKYRS